MDFTEIETTAGGIWRIGGVCDYWAKVALAGRVAATATATDLIATLEEGVCNRKLHELSSDGPVCYAS